MRRLRMLRVAVVVLGAVAVIGCGGGGGDGGQVRILEEQLASEEAARLEAERKAAEEAAAKLEAEKKAAEQLAAEEAARIAAEQKAAAEEAARLEAEKKAAEEKARLEAEKAEAELKAAREEIARLMAEAELAEAEEEPDPLLDEPAHAGLPGAGGTVTDQTDDGTDDDAGHAGLNPLLGGDDTGTPATPTTTPTTAPTTPQQSTATQSLEANQRSERLLTVLRAVTPPAIAAGASTSSRVVISVPSRNSLTFKNSDYTVSTTSAPKLRGARLTRSRGGTQTTLVYTDIELSRSLIKTYDDDADATIVEFPLSDVGTVAAFDALADDDAVTIPRPSSIPSTKAATDTDTKSVSESSFRGSLHGVSGTFSCTDDCTLTGVYNTAGTTLITLTLSGTAPVFKPDSRIATVSLCTTPRSQCAATDADYMAFGWWRSESTDGSYQFEPFAFGPALATALTLPDGVTSAEFNGTAVGMYVEQSKAGAAIAKKQGEFTANARLDYASGALTGTIDGFKTTPTAGSGAPSTTGWILKLNAAGAAALQLHGPDGTGTWTHGYTTDGSAVVGTFQAGFTVGDSATALTDAPLTIAGAFGAQR